MNRSSPIPSCPLAFGEPSAPVTAPVPHASRLTPHVSRLTYHVSRFTHHAFTLLEILVSVALLSFIVLGLFAMFNQTQRAFRSSMTQSDILEAGRAVTEMIPRELEQTAPSYRSAVNFCTVMFPNSAPLTQFLPGVPPPNQLVRTNFLEDLFLLRRENQTWIGIGYCVRTADTNGYIWLPESSPNRSGPGTLYRFMATLPYLSSGAAGTPNTGLPQDPGQLYTAFTKACAPGSLASASISRICDGVIHFRLRAFADNGFPLFSDGFNTNACFRTNALTPGYSLLSQTVATANPSYPDNLSSLYFWSNAVPATVEMELGLLEQSAWDRYSSIGSAAARLAYLQREETSSRVHLFRQRIPIRNVDPSSYP